MSIDRSDPCKWVHVVTVIVGATARVIAIFDSILNVQYYTPVWWRNVNLVAPLARWVRASLPKPEMALVVVLLRIDAADVLRDMIRAEKSNEFEEGIKQLSFRQ